MQLTVTQAALVCHVSTKTIYTYIKLAVLKATPKPSIRKVVPGKVGPAAYIIELDSLTACPYLSVDTRLLATIAPQTPLPVSAAPVISVPVTSTPVPRTGGIVQHDLPRIESVEVGSHAELPQGILRFTEFFKAHGVNEWTARDELRNKLIAVTTVPTNRKDGQREKWVTPSQQRQMVTVWRRLSTPGFSACAACPHSLDASEG